MNHSERDRQERSRLQHEAEHARPHKKVSVFGYLAILFAVAFLLLLMSYFMQQRSNQEAMDNLQATSDSAVQTLENILTQRDELQQQVADLQKEKEDLEGEKAQLESSLEQGQEDQAQLERQLEAMGWFWRIQPQYSRGYTRAARELAEAFEATGLPDALPDTSYAEPDGPSPKDQYQELYDILF